MIRDDISARGQLALLESFPLMDLDQAGLRVHLHRPRA